MRILTVGNLYPPHHLGGYELVWQAAVGALRGAGHEVRVLCASDRLAGDDVGEEDAGVHRELRWYWRGHGFPRLSVRERLRLERHNHAVLARHLDELDADVVSWWSMGGMSLSLIEAVRRRGLPAIGWVNDDWLRYGRRVDQWTAMWAGRPRARRVADRLTGIPTTYDHAAAARWIFCSEATRQGTLAKRPELSDTAVLHQGVAPVFTAAGEQPWQGRLLYAGRIDERKGLATLVEAVGGMPDMTLDIVGSGDDAYTARLLGQAAASGAAQRVRLTGALTRAGLAEAYAGCDAVVFPVEWLEPWGLVPLEAMAVGRPVIATGRGGSAEYLEHERNCLLFPAGDSGALRDAALRLAADPQLRARLRAGGFATAAQLTEAAWTAALVAEHERLGGTEGAAPAQVAEGLAQ